MVEGSLGDTRVQVGAAVYDRIDFGPLTVLCRRHVGPYSTVTATWIELLASAAQLGMQDLTRVGVVYDDPSITPPDEIRYDACVVLPEEVANLRRVQPLPDSTRVEQLAAVAAWRNVHVGSFRTLGEAYVGARSAADFQDRGLEPPAANPPFYELYRTDPRHTPDDKQVTEVILPLARYQAS